MRRGAVRAQCLSYACCVWCGVVCCALSASTRFTQGAGESIHAGRRHNQDRPTSTTLRRRR